LQQSIAMDVDEILDEIAQNEQEALEVYQLPEDTSEMDLIKAFKHAGIANWETNLTLLDEVAEFELDDSFENYINKLKKYYTLRRDTFKLILKAIEEDTDDYNDQIDQYDAEIESLIKEIDELRI
jgi:rhomboid protease GluP